MDCLCSKTLTMRNVLPSIGQNIGWCTKKHFLFGEICALVEIPILYLGELLKKVQTPALYGSIFLRVYVTLGDLFPIR